MGRLLWEMNYNFKVSVFSRFRNLDIDRSNYLLYVLIRINTIMGG